LDTTWPRAARWSLKIAKRFASSRRTTAEVSACGLAEGQLFIKRNKRVALAALHTFLLINGLQINASQEERARWILDLAAVGRTAEERVTELAARLRKSTVPHPDEVDEGEE